MSATNRGGVRDKDDNYATPAWATNAIVPVLKSFNRRVDHVLDPCAGAGAILVALRKHFPKAFLRGIELDRVRAGACNAKDISCVNADALKPEIGWNEPKFIVTNPPYKHAMAFVQKSLMEIAPGGVIAMLLRLNWLESLARAEFHKAHPADIYVFSKRPSFTGGHTDATAYCFMVWSATGGGRWSILDAEPRK